MTKASPVARSFNAGEFSDLMGGRTDLERYPASLRSSMNFVAAPQGPAIARSGTAFVQEVRPDTKLIPFVFSEAQALVLAFDASRVTFFAEEGQQVYPAVAGTYGEAGGRLTVTSATLNAAVGDDVVVSGVPEIANLNGRSFRVTAKAGNLYTLSPGIPVGFSATGEVSRVYHVPCVYTPEQLKGLRAVGSGDVLYLLTPLARPRKLQRYGAYDWRLSPMMFKDGPYGPINDTRTRMGTTGTGNAIPDMTSDTEPSGAASASSNRPSINGTPADPIGFIGRDLTYSLPESKSWYAFSYSKDNYWASNTAQSGTIAYRAATPFVADGYAIVVPRASQDTSYLAKDYAPSTFEFQGLRNGVWYTLDRQDTYVLYEGGSSTFFPVNNETAYEGYRLSISELTRNGLIEPRIQNFLIRSQASRRVTLNASAVVGINRDRGFLATDVGRSVRLKGVDGVWRELVIETVNSNVSVVARILGAPFTEVGETTQWRMGYWSETTGWPSTADFMDDRLFLAGSDEAPDLVAGSVIGAYEDFSQTDTFGEVLDTSAVVLRLNARGLSRIQWLSADERGMLLGTGTEEYTLSANVSNETLTARNPKARPASRRGSSNVEPVRVDLQVLYVQRGGRTVREIAFVFESDGYKSPSMSQLASHLGQIPFEEMVYSSEPYSVIWVRRADGSVVALTYDRDENVVGWHRHDFSGGKVESMAVIPQRDGLQDALWMVVERRVNGTAKHYLERLTRFWDFNTALADAHFVDCGLRYVGGPLTQVYGLQHLEGQEVFGLADGLPVGPFVVTNGGIELEFEARNIVVGLGFDSEAVIPRFDAGARDGTAQGKVKRINSLVALLWRSAGGEIGMWNAEREEYVYEPIEYPGRMDIIEDTMLYSGHVGPITPTPGYDMDAFIAFRRTKDSPLPFNVVAVMPQGNTQDR